MDPVWAGNLIKMRLDELYAICLEYPADEILDSPLIEVPDLAECLEVGECDISEAKLQVAIALRSLDALLGDLGVLALESDLVLWVLLIERPNAVALADHLLYLHLPFFLVLLFVLL
jgi:hypothetical protein